MLRAALKLYRNDKVLCCLIRLDTHNAACGIETFKDNPLDVTHCSLDTHNAACGIETMGVAIHYSIS